MVVIATLDPRDLGEFDLSIGETFIEDAYIEDAYILCLHPTNYAA